jgi:hypothetical protein
MDIVKSKFNMTQERLEELNNGSTKFVKDHLQKVRKEEEFRSSCLKLMEDITLRNEFCSKNNVDYADIITVLEKNNSSFKDLGGLDPTLDTYYQFGADKAGVTNLKEFLERLNIDYEDLALLVHTKINDTYPKGYSVYSRDKKLVLAVFSTQSLEGYFHYMGVTGEAKAVYQAFKAFLELGTYEELCWGGRDFI